jgi:hypothetical protein
MSFLTDDLVKLKTKHSESEKEPGILCDCSADCEEPDQFVLHEEKRQVHYIYTTAILCFCLMP